MDKDIVIQKVITGHATQAEKDWLLDNLMKLYNEILILLSKKRYNEWTNAKTSCVNGIESIQPPWKNKSTNYKNSKKTFNEKSKKSEWW